MASVSDHQSFTTRSLIPKTNDSSGKLKMLKNLFLMWTCCRYAWLNSFVYFNVIGWLFKVKIRKIYPPNKVAILCTVTITVSLLLVESWTENHTCSPAVLPYPFPQAPQVLEFRWQMLTICVRVLCEEKQIRKSFGGSTSGLFIGGCNRS